jgi:hypothetical protein
MMSKAKSSVPPQTYSTLVVAQLRIDVDHAAAQNFRAPANGLVVLGKNAARPPNSMRLSGVRR